MAEILHNLRVLFVGSDIAGSLCSMLLCDQGAEIIQIIQKNEGYVDSLTRSIVNRGFKQIKLDLRDVNTTIECISLLETADVIIDTVKSLKLKENGIDVDKIRETKNPGLICLRIPHFADEDPRSGLPESELFPSMAGLLYEKPIGHPYHFSFSIASFVAALYGANNIVMALIGRVNHGKGINIEVSLYESALAASAFTIAANTGLPKKFTPLQMLGSPFLGVWPVANDEYIYLHVGLPDHLKKALIRFEELGYQKEVAELKSILKPNSLKDPTLLGGYIEANKARNVMKKILSTKNSLEWEELLGKDNCCVKIRTLEEWCEFQPPQQAGEIIPLQEEVLPQKQQSGEAIQSILKQPGLALHFSETPGSVKRGIIQLSSLKEVRDSWKSRDTKKGDATSAMELPLKGLKVLDLSRIIAGPMAARTLAEYGAEVTLIENPRMNVDWVQAFHLAFNPGKKSVTIDLSTPEGRDILWKFSEIYKPDIVVVNFRSIAVAKRMGLDYETFRKKFPEIIYTHLNAYGFDGLWNSRPAFEQIVQAACGIQLHYTHGQRPKLFPMPINDIGLGLLGSLGTAMAIYQKMKTGKAQHVRASLSMAAILIQLKEFARVNKKILERRDLETSIDIQPPFIETIISCKDTIAGLAIRRSKWKDMIDLKPFHVLKRYEVDPENPTCMTAIEKIMKTKPIDQWKKWIAENGLDSDVGILRRYKAKDAIEDTKSVDPRDIPQVRKYDYPEAGIITFTTNPTRLHPLKIVDLYPSVIRGTHTSEVYKMLGHKYNEGFGIMHYPKDKPKLLWILNTLRWVAFLIHIGYF